MSSSPVVPQTISNPTVAPTVAPPVQPVVPPAARKTLRVPKVKFGVNSGKNTGKIIIGVVLLFVVVYVGIYVYKLYTSTSLKTTTLLKKPISIPYAETNLTKDIALPSNTVGNQYSISLWIYIDDMSPTKKDKFILSRGNEVEFYLNKENKLLVDVGSKQLSYGNLPTNRWVNIILIVDESLATLYVDGKFTEAKTGTYKKVSGNVIVGKSNYKERTEGYMSKVQVFNYALTIDHSQIIYKAGPLHKSILSMVGIPMYGLRSPFVRLDEVNLD